MTTPKEWKRLSFQEALELIRLPDETATQQPIQKFISRQPAWTPGQELPWNAVGITPPKITRGAYGAVVYAQAALAATRVVEQEDGSKHKENKRGIHSIHAVFTNPGLSDRPFFLDVSEVHSSRSFSTRLVHARQSTQPSSKPLGPFPESDAQAPLGSPCLTSIITFKRPVPSSDEVQGIPPQERFKEILSLRKPDEWDPCPQADVDALKAKFPNEGHGVFPILDMYKVDMSAFNADKLIPDRRELIYYRLLKPLPKEDANSHVLCHAFEADRNSLFMLGNHLGYGHNLGIAASLSYSFYVHVNAEEAVMEGSEWWIQEVSWPRFSAGRGAMESLIWSPQGKHIATGYQDGIVLPMTAKPDRETKL
ncbi:thioesterase-like superfamily-domain-containing protein [Fusarium tricinctum]|uniref:Thioesterase-like superfamily-domain-containing protein n=1 Tax=Fusarium tricinctum TaxID=61284 RepID=A0A8K0S9X6_9HYPO|nr:thioesterase-like superfamily-domain-containing protein [Fusarium tricinctum]